MRGLTGRTATPEERIDAAYQELRQALIAEVRDRISAVSPTAFEDLVLDVLHAMGYGDGTEDSRLRTGASGDAGIDGVIRGAGLASTSSTCRRSDASSVDREEKHDRDSDHDRNLDPADASAVPAPA